MAYSGVGLRPKGRGGFLRTTARGGLFGEKRCNG
jgi:hypothetical protein